MKEFLAEGRNFFSVEFFAAEDVDECAVAEFVEVCGDAACLDELHHAVAAKASGAEALDAARPVAFHAKEGAQFANVAPNRGRVIDEPHVTIV